MFASFFVVVLGLCKESAGQSSLGQPYLYGPSEALVKSVGEFHCYVQTYPNNETILLELFKEGQYERLLGEYSSLDGEIAHFPMVIRTYHEGNLECVARAQNNSNIEPTYSNLHYLKVIEKVKGATVEVRSELVEFFEGETLDLHCTLTAGNHVSYTWLLNGRPVSQPSHHDQLLVYRTTSKDSGSYMCIAMNQFNNTDVFTSNSSEVVITVKDVVSNPDISFTVLKEDFHNYSAVVTCESAKGTPPVTFSLYNRTELVANMTVEERTAIFKLPLVLDQHLGWLQCQAENGDQTAYSKWIPLEVVTVGGPVQMHYNYDVGENYAVIGLRFYCKAARGSLPRYQWFLNKTHLPDRGSFYYVIDQPPEESILLLSVGRSSAGTYHCEVSDSFDNTTAISSKSWYLDKDVVNGLPTWVVAVVFGCFIVDILMVSVCCWIGVVFRRRQDAKKSLSGLEMEGMEAACELELDSTDYNEDTDVVMAAGDDETDQASEASVDEWPLIEEERKTLEDEAAEEP